jgi:hypothetical protein
MRSGSSVREWSVDMSLGGTQVVLLHLSVKGYSITFGGRVRLRRPEISPIFPLHFLLSLAAPHLHGVLVLVIGNKFIAVVVVTGNNCSPVSLSPVINLSSLSPAIIVNDTGEKFIAGINDNGNH